MGPIKNRGYYYTHNGLFSVIKCLYSFDLTHFRQLKSIKVKKWTKIVNLQITIFGLKMIVKSGIGIFIFNSYEPSLNTMQSRFSDIKFSDNL
jgi:hypothetical protein